MDQLAFAQSGRSHFNQLNNCVVAHAVCKDAESRLSCRIEAERAGECLESMYARYELPCGV